MSVITACSTISSSSVLFADLLTNFKGAYCNPCQSVLMVHFEVDERNLALCYRLHLLAIDSPTRY